MTRTRTDIQKQGVAAEFAPRQQLVDTAERAWARWMRISEEIGLEQAALDGELDALFDALEPEQWDQIGLHERTARE